MISTSSRTGTTGTTGTTTALAEPPASDASEMTALVTGLFTGGLAIRREGVSPAGAFQDALYGRSVLIDVRPLAERLRNGHVDPRLFGQVVPCGDDPDPLTAAYQATLDHPGVPAHILAADDATARRIVTRLRWFAVAAEHVEGGFAAWRSAGLPTLQAA